MRRILNLLLSLAFVLTSFLCVSCADDAPSVVSDPTAEVSLHVSFPSSDAGDGAEKGLVVSVDGGILALDPENLYWRYTAVKLDSFGRTGERTSEYPLKGTAASPEKGLPSSISGLSAGRWRIRLFAYTTTAGWDSSGSLNPIVCGSEDVEVTLRPDRVNVVQIPVGRVQRPGVPGVLHIDPSKISVAISQGSVVVFSTDSSRAEADPNAYKSAFSSNLADYKFRIYECSEDWSIKNEGEYIIDTTADVAFFGSGTAAKTTKTDLSLEPGSHFIKVEVYRTRDAGDSKAEQFLALVTVNIYSNAVSTLSNNESDGRQSGIDVKRLKSFSITYKAFTPGTEPAEANIIDWNSDMIHGRISTDDPNRVDNFHRIHQYGRTEELDSPTYGTNGFAGYYYNAGTSAEPDWRQISSIPAFYYEDITVYAKWSPMRYRSISYEPNYPAGALDTTWTDSSGRAVNNSGAFYDTSKSDTSAPMMPATNPSATGYVFLGWYVKALENTGTIWNSTNYDGDEPTFKGLKYIYALPGAVKADIDALCVGVWRPVRYHVAVQCKSSINPAEDFTNYPEISRQVAELWTGRWSYYGESYDIIDPESDKYGFIGYLRGTTSDHNPDSAVNTTYVQANMWTNAEYHDLSTTDGEVVYWYALFSDYFNPLEYIRSYPTGQTSGPLIKTGAPCNLTSSGVSRLVMDIELAGQEYGGRGFVCGSSASPYNFLLATTGDRSGAWRWWSGGTDGVVGDGYKDVGRYFEDERYLIDMNISDSMSTLSVNGSQVESLPHASSRFHGGQIVFFGWEQNESAYNHRGDYRLFSAEFYNSSGNLIRRFKPCVLKGAVPAAFSADGLATHTSGEVGLWDLVTNKFYANASSTGRFYQPSEEVEIRLHRNTTDSDSEVRVQRVIKGVSEQLHRNLFTTANREFMGWAKTAHGEKETSDRLVYSATTNCDLYAVWSSLVSYNLFSQVEWIENYHEAYILSDADINADARATTVMALHNRPTTSTEALCVFGARISDSSAFMLHILFRASTGWACTFSPRMSGLVLDLSQEIILDQKYFIDMDNTGQYLRIFQGEDNTGTALINTPAPRKTDMPGYKFGLFCAMDLGTGYAEYGYDSAHSKNNSGVHWAHYGHKEYRPDKKYDTVGNSGSIRCFNFNYYSGGELKFELVPAVLTVDLTSSTSCIDANGVYHEKASEKVFGGRDAYAGEAGMWDLKTDIFYGNVNPFIADSRFLYPDTQYTIYYNGNGALGTMDAQTVLIADVGTGVRLLENKYSMQGHIFLGWNTQSDGSGEWYSDERVMHLSGKKALRNMTLFAQWKALPTAVEYEALDYVEGGGSEDLHSVIRVKDVFDAEWGARIEYGMMVPPEGLRWLHINGLGEGSNYGMIYNNYIPYEPTGSAFSTLSAGTAVHVRAHEYDNGKHDIDAWIGSSSTPSVSVHEKAQTSYPKNKNNGHLTIFSNYAWNNAAAKYSFKLSSFKAWNAAEELKVSLIPVILTGDADGAHTFDGLKHHSGELGMLNLVDGKFYANANPSYPSALFTHDKYVIVQYNANGDGAGGVGAVSGSMNASAFLSGTDAGGAALPENAFLWPGHSFIGWNTRADGTGIWFSDGYASENWGVYGKNLITLYAVWSGSTGWNGSAIGSVSTDYFDPVNRVVTGGSGNYIDLDRPMIASSVFKMQFSMPERYTGTEGGWWGVVGSRRIKRSPSTVQTGYILWFNPASSAAGLSGFGGSVEMSETGRALSSYPFGGSFLELTWNVPGRAQSITRDGVSIASASITHVVDDEHRLYIGKGSGYGDDGFQNYPSFNLWLYGAEYLDAASAVHLVPCRLVKKIGTYEAGSISSDGSTHKVGEVGFWDILNNVFYANANTGGTLTCELD